MAVEDGCKRMHAVEQDVRGTGDDYAYSVVQTGDGGYVLAGFTGSLGAGSADFWLVKTASEAPACVPYHSQVKWYYCGPACLEMMFHFFGPDISQTEIADAARTDLAYSGTYTDDMRRATHFSDLSTSAGNEMPGSVTGYTGRGLGYAAFEYYFPNINGLKPLIDSGFPIIVLTAGDSSKSWGHFRVVVAYDDASSKITMQDPLYGANYQLDYATFDDWWQSWSVRWGLFIHPWDVATIAPATVQEGDTFVVSSTVTYPCPPPFPTSAFPASSPQATIQLPIGLSLASGETPTKSLGTGPLIGGSSTAVQWKVKANCPGSFSITMDAEGQISGSVITHGPNPGYSYTDRIGGTGNTSVTVYGEPTHDVAVSNLVSSKTVVGHGFSTSISVTIVDQGNYPETFNLTAYANATSIASQNITLSSGNSTTITFMWNTTGFAKGNYTISAYAEPVQGETNTDDNMLTDGIVKVTIIGDVNGDGKVNIIDTFAVALAYGSYPGHPTWKPNYDINNDGKINLIDYFVTALNYGKTDP